MINPTINANVSQFVCHSITVQRMRLKHTGTYVTVRICTRYLEWNCSSPGKSRVVGTCRVLQSRSPTIPSVSRSLNTYEASLQYRQSDSKKIGFLLCFPNFANFPTCRLHFIYLGKEPYLFCSRAVKPGG